MTRILFNIVTYFTYTLLYILYRNTNYIYYIEILACNYPTPHGMSGFRMKKQAKIC